MTISQYIERLQAGFKLGNATEHTYRGYLQTLLETIATGVAVTNEPARIKCGAPDYVITHQSISSMKSFHADILSQNHNPPNQIFLSSISLIILKIVKQKALSASA
ncbi:hypothetical protein ACVW0P_003132 [Mucilaginibacter sp. UYNi724]